MTGEPEQKFDPWDADIWTLEAMGFDAQEIIRGEQDAGEEEADDFEAYRERVLAPLRRLAERLRAEDEGEEDGPSDRMGTGAGGAEDPNGAG